MNKMSRILKAIIQTFSFARRGLSRLVAWPFGLTGMILVRYVPCYRRLPVLAQKLVASLLVLTITITSLYSLSFLFAEKTSAAWFDDSWSYRQRIPIDTHTAAETNVYNEMSVDTATLTTDKLQADCDDLRFTKENGEILPYQIVSGCDTATTVIRVGFDTMPIVPFNIYMYYGNPSATSVSTTFATWNPSDKSASITFSGSDLTATGPTSGSTFFSVRATIGKSSGKWYWESTGGSTD